VEKGEIKRKREREVLKDDIRSLDRLKTERKSMQKLEEPH